MNKSVALAGGGIVIVGLLMALIVGLNVMGTYNEWISKEQGIVAQYNENQNDYDKMFKTIVEMAQVPKEYASKVKEMYDSTMRGRYGVEGSKAMFQMLTEVNPTLDPKMYEKVQQVIESSRTKFAANQTTLLDKKRAYVTELQQFPGFLYAGILGFPKIDLAKYDIVTSEETQEAFKTKKSAPINVFGN